jgi:hypothetical protein
MAMNIKGPSKPRPAQKPAPISLKDELEADELAAAPPAEIESVAAAPLEPVSLEPVSLEPVSAELAPEPPTVVAAVMTASVSAPSTATAAAPALDPSQWPLKTFDLFNENAAAMLDLALALGKAQSMSDALELQSRFASERYSSLMKQTNELMDLTRLYALEATAPVRIGFSAFVA